MPWWWSIRKCDERHCKHDAPFTERHGLEVGRIGKGFWWRRRSESDVQGKLTPLWHMIKQLSNKTVSKVCASSNSLHLGLDLSNYWLYLKAIPSSCVLWNDCEQSPGSFHQVQPWPRSSWGMLLTLSTSCSFIENQPSFKCFVHTFWRTFWHQEHSVLWSSSWYLVMLCSSKCTCIVLKIHWNVLFIFRHTPWRPYLNWKNWLSSVYPVKPFQSLCLAENRLKNE